MELTIIQRVKKLCKWLIFLGIAENESELAAELGYTKSSLSQLLNEKKPLSNKFIDKLCDLDKKVNKVYIKEGIGDFLIETEKKEDEINYKQLAEARLEIIEGLKFKVATLEKELATKESDSNKRRAG